MISEIEEDRIVEVSDTRMYILRRITDGYSILIYFRESADSPNWILA